MFLKQATMASVLLYLVSSVLLLQLLFPISHARTCRLLSCKRKAKMESYGYDTFLKPVQIDVGECTAVYEDSKDCELPADSQTQTVQSPEPQQEGSGAGEQYEPCPRRCEPRSYSRIQSSNRYSPITVHSVRNCYGTRHHCLKECVRKPNYVYMFPGSKYQQRIDVGKCVGQCVGNSTSTLECVTIRHKSVAVEGPNGFEAVQTVQECSCENTLCYRADHFQSFSELVMDQSNNTTTQKKRRERLINIGKCIGSCPGVKIPGTCYPSDDNCQFYFGERPARCAPTAGELHTYIDLDQNTQTVAAIRECGCGTG